MDNVNPLGQIMHLRELDRQATPQHRPLRPAGESKPIVTMIATVVLRVYRAAFPKEPLSAPLP